MATAPNTPAIYYLDSAAAQTTCKEEKKHVEQKCAADDKHKHRGKGKPKARDKHKDAGKEADWVMDHCGPLLVQPGENFTEWMKEFGDIESVMRQLARDLGDKVISKIEREILEYGGRALGKLALRRGLTGWIPVVGWIMTAVDVAVTAVEVTGKVTEMKAVVTDLKDTVKNLEEQARKITGTFEKYKDKLKNYGKLSKEQQGEVAREVMADVQMAYATANPCLRAKKCLLVPFNKGTADKWMGKGCCPGQTGHHLLPDAMFRDEAGTKKLKEDWKNDPSKVDKDGKKTTPPRDKYPKKACWDGYSEGGSPTICAEGANQHSGSHGVLHGRTKYKIDRSGYANEKEMPYTKARDLILDDVQRIYGCSKKCLQAQLDTYYCGKAASKRPGCPSCKDAKVVPHDGINPPKLRRKCALK